MADPVTAVSVGESHVCVVTKSGDAQCWGLHNGFLLGDGTNAESSVEPVRVAGGHRFTTIAAGGPFTCGLEAAQAYCWGAYDGGQLGGGALKDSSRVPRAVVGAHRFAGLSAGLRHACALDEAGSAWCWGANDVGQLGVASPKASGTPVAVVGGHTFTTISASAIGACGVDAQRVVWCWGDGGAAVPKFTPKQADDLSGAVALNRNCAVDAAGAAKCAGASPVTGEKPFKSIAANGAKRCAVDGDGVAWCWGLNIDGHLGVESDSKCTLENGASWPCATRPARLRRQVRFASISVGFNDTYCGVNIEGRVYCWGLDPSQEGPAAKEPRLVTLKP